MCMEDSILSNNILYKHMISVFEKHIMQIN